MSFTIGGGVNLEECYSNLLTSDINNDGYISQSEFLLYLQTSSSNDGLFDTNQYGSPLTTFSMLPQEFVGMYNFFACGDPYVGCPSVIGIDIRGLLVLLQSNNNNKEELSEQETTFLYRLCKDTEDMVEEYEATMVGTTTNRPTEEPTTVISTTSVPTPSPIDIVSSTTSSPTSSSSSSSSSTSCPPQYNAGQSYTADELVSNNQIYQQQSSSSSSSIPYFKCKPFPFAAWCSQAAYEPGVTIAWEEAWELMGVCVVEGDDDDDETTTTTSSTSATTTGTSVVTTSTAPTNPSLSTSSPPTPQQIIPSKQPTTFTNPEESPTTGPLPVQFQYEIGNDQNIQSQSIWMGRNPNNTMMGYLESGTDGFVQLIMDATFGFDSGGSSSSSSLSLSSAGAVSKDSLKTTNENVRKRRTTRTTTTRTTTTRTTTTETFTKRRNLAVTYNTTSVSIQTIQDIACSYPNMTPESRCQKVTAGVTLQLINEPPLTTNLRFQSGISRGIDMGLLSFPPESGIVYVGETKAVQVIPELGGTSSRVPNGIGGGGNNNNNTNGSSSNNTAAVAVSVTVVAIVAAVLILFAGSRFRKRQREGKEFDGAQEVSLEGDGNGIENDLSPKYYQPSGSTSIKRQTNPFEETIEETPIFKDDDSDLIDLERGGSVDMTTPMNHSNNDQHQSSNNPFASSSSSGSSSSSSGDLYPQHQPVSKGFPLPSWKEVSEEDLSKSGEMGEIYMRDHDNTDYRAGVEALVRQACPEHIDSVDDMMAEYEGREAVLIGQLSVMLAAQKEGEDRNDSFSSENSKKVLNEPRLKAVQESDAVLRTSESIDESSAAGSSQWSTDDGMSSIDASMSQSSSEREMLPDSYAAIGDAALTISDSNLKTTTFIQVEKNPDDEFSGLEIPGGSQEKSRDQPISREDLDAAIEAGDWQAVGATAALLAGNARERRDSESGDSSIQSDYERSEVSLSSMDNSDKDRASEFEKLIEAGDWKAVMEIASEFEGAGESSNFQFSKLSEMDYEDSRRLSSSEIFEGNDQVMDKRQEIEELVRRVVPDEIENIDEMMMQFQGRENELILTLKTMEERNQNSSDGGSNSSLSPQSSKEASADLSSSNGQIVFEGDSALNESDRYETDRKSSKSNTSSLQKSSQFESSSSSEDLTKLVRSEF
eukprot:scaffold291_cov143-Skeletonema_menzelii.AAC.3